MAEFTDGTGAIDGVVVDLNFLPVAGANVTLETPSGEAEVLGEWVTGLDGAFAFSHLTPGTYKVRAVTVGYGNGTSLANVLAGEAAHVALTVDLLPSNEPYIDIYIQEGILKCAFSAVVWADTCTTKEVMGENVNQMDFNITAGHRWVVVETTWDKPGVTMDHDFFTRNPDEEPRGLIIGRGFGKPILRTDLWPLREYQATPLAPKNLFPASENETVLRIETWFDGQYQEESNTALGPACGYMLLGYCTGLGVELEFTFTEYVSVFMNGVPSNIESYSAIPDA